MAFFGVTIETISNIKAHPNADRLLLAELEGLGFQFVIPIGSWKVGDKCLYFPIDSILPEDLLAKMNLTGKLAGAQKNRVKTIKLRGEISQGIVGPLALIEGLDQSEWNTEKITTFLDVRKYEPEIDLPISHAGNLIELPDGVGIYDIEGTERYPSALEALLDVPVWISEKLEGSHFACSFIDGKIWVCQRRFAIEPTADQEHFFWQVARDQGLLELLENIKLSKNIEHLTLRGEIIGPNIQSNIYRLPERKIFLFDVAVNKRYLGAEQMFDLLTEFNANDKIVPTLAKGDTLRNWLSGKTIQEAANGLSLLHNTSREGIVIRPIHEAYHEELFGRLILKQRSPEYLAKSDA